MKRRRSGAVETPRVALQHPIHCFCCRRIQAKIVTTDRVGAVSRKGNVVTRVLERVTKIAAEVFVRETVSHKVSLLATDQSRVYDGLTDYPHGTVDHGHARQVQKIIEDQAKRFVTQWNLDNRPKR